MYIKYRWNPLGFTKLEYVREQKAVPLENQAVPWVNQAFARVTPAIFVIFVVSRGLSSKALVLLVRTQIRHVFVKNHSFWRDKGTAYQRQAAEHA